MLLLYAFLKKELIVSTQFKFSISDASIHRICGRSDVAAVYGFQHCFYDQIKNGLERHPQIKRIYDLSLGENRPEYMHYVHVERITRLDGSKLEQIDSGITEQTEPPMDGVRMAARQCKASITNLIVENLKRNLNGQECIPIIVCFDKENNNIPPQAENLLSKTKKIKITPTFEIDMNSIVTHSEMRRMYKLCDDEMIDPLVKDVARRSFRFVRVVEVERTVAKTDSGEEVHIKYDLSEIPPAWALEGYQEELAKRKLLPKRPNALEKRVDWRAQVNQIKEREVARK